MKKVLIPLITALVALCALPAVAGATVTWRFGEDGYVDAYNPAYFAGGYVEAHGHVNTTNGNTVDLEIEVCLEKAPPGQGWSGPYYCHTVNGPNADSIDTYSSGQIAGCGTWFRSYVWAYQSVYEGRNIYHDYATAGVGDANYLC